MKGLEERLADLIRALPFRFSEYEALEEGRIRHKGALFIDIAGFTSLTEKCESAEQVSRLLDKISQPIISTAEGIECKLLAQEGDGMLFSADPLNAAYLSQQAFEILNLMRNVKTPQGIVTLDMHNGIGSGEVFEAIIGTKRRAYVMLGEAITAAYESERKAKNGETVIDENSHHTLKPLTKADSSVDKRLLRTIKGIKLTPQPETTKLPKSEQEQFRIYKQIRPFFHDEETIQHAYFRNVTSLFMDLPAVRQIVERTLIARKILGGDVTDEEVQKMLQYGKDAGIRGGAQKFLERMASYPPKKIQEQLTELYDRIRFIVEEKYGGVVDKFKPHNALFTFGTYQSHGDDEQRALLSAVEIRRELEKRSAEWNLPHEEANAGIEIGKTFIGAIAGSMEAIGNPVNLAARLKAASNGKILFGPRVHHRLEGEVKIGKSGVTKAGERQFKGLEKEIKYYTLDKVIERERKHTTRMYGREKEWAQLNQAIQKKGYVRIGIKGEAGIGKSRFVAEFKRALLKGRWQVYTGKCTLFDKNTPFKPFSDIIRQVLGLTHQNKERALLSLKTTYSDEVLPYVAELLGYEFEGYETYLTGEQKKERIREAIKDTIWGMYPQVAIHIEDLHWADKDTIETIKEIQESYEQTILITDYRPELNIELDEEISLEALTDKALIRLQQELYSERQVKPPSKKDQEYLAIRAKGNPLFMQVIVNHLPTKKGEIEGDVRKAKIPDKIEDIIIADMDRLDREQRRAMEVLSVIGEQTNLKIAQEMLGNRIRFTQGLLNSGWINKLIGTGETRLAFQHALYQEIIYARINDKDKKALHEKAARAYEKTQEKGLTAHHWRRSNLIRGKYHENEAVQKAFEYTMQHAEELIRRFGATEAVETEIIDLIERLKPFEDIDEPHYCLLVAKGYDRMADLAQFKSLEANERYATRQLSAAHNAIKTGGRTKEFFREYVLALHSAAAVCTQKQDYKKGLRIEQKAEEHARKIGDDTLLAEVLAYQGTIYFQLYLQGKAKLRELRN